MVPPFREKWTFSSGDRLGIVRPIRQQLKTAKVPVIEVLRTAWRRFLMAIGANALGIAGFYFTSTFMIAFTIQYLGLPRAMVLNCLFVVAICQFCGQPLAALMAEKVGDSRFLLWTSGLSMLTPYFLFSLVETKRVPIMIVGIATSVVIMASFYAVMTGFASIASPRVRYSGISLASDASIPPSLGFRLCVSQVWCARTGSTEATLSRY